MSLPEGFSLGPYRIVTLIGRGGMASVYKGHHRALDRDVAIKVLPEFFAEDETYQERFHQEARSVARLNHPNILTVFDFGQEADGVAEGLDAASSRPLRYFPAPSMRASVCDPRGWRGSVAASSSATATPGSCTPTSSRPPSSSTPAAS